MQSVRLSLKEIGDGYESNEWWNENHERVESDGDVKFQTLGGDYE